MPLPPGYPAQFMARGDIQAIGHRRAQVVRETAVELAHSEVKHRGTIPDYHSSFVSVGPQVLSPVVLVWFIGNKAPHAKYIEHGTKPHSIDARNVPNLVFFWEKRNVTFVGPHVDHPGAYHGVGKKILERALRISGGGAFR